MSEYTVDQIRAAWEAWEDVYDFLERQFNLWTEHDPSGRRWDEIIGIVGFGTDTIEFRVLDMDGDREYRTVPLSVLVDTDEILKQAERKRRLVEEAAREARREAEALARKRREAHERSEFARLKKKFEPEGGLDTAPAEPVESSS